MSRKQLNSEGVIAARLDEVKYLQSYDVYEKVLKNAGEQLAARLCKSSGRTSTRATALIMITTVAMDIKMSANRFIPGGRLRST